MLRDRGADVRLEGGASARPRHRRLDLGAIGLAGVVEISVDRQSGKIKVHKVWVAIDGGIIVSPSPAKANIESAIIYGLSGVLHERVTLKDGVVEQTNFHDYNLMHCPDLPDELHVEVATRRRGRPASARSAIHSSPPRSRTRSTGSPANGCATCRSRRSGAPETLKA